MHTETKFPDMQTAHRPDATGDPWGRDHDRSDIAHCATGRTYQNFGVPTANLPTRGNDLPLHMTASGYPHGPLGYLNQQWSTTRHPDRPVSSVSTYFSTGPAQNHNFANFVVFSQFAWT